MGRGLHCRSWHGASVGSAECALGTRSPDLDPVSCRIGLRDLNENVDLTGA